MADAVDAIKFHKTPWWGYLSLQSSPHLMNNHYNIDRPTVVRTNVRIFNPQELCSEGYRNWFMDQEGIFWISNVIHL